MPADQSETADSQPASAQSVRTCRLPLSPSPKSEAAQFSKYAIVGSYVPKCDDCFFQHVAILSEATTLDGFLETNVFHMAPPPVAGVKTASLHEKHQKMTPQLVGDLVLTNDECEAVANWLAEVDSECAASSVPLLQYYKIRPHVETPLSEEGRRLPRRFSCSGFVIEAYRDAGIELLEIESIPKVSAETLRPAYRFFFVVESHPKEHEKYGFKGREDLGVDDSEEWDVVLPGYLFHSTDRATEANSRPTTPFVPGTEHRCYPCSETVN